MGEGYGVCLGVTCSVEGEVEIRTAGGRGASVGLGLGLRA